MKKITLLLSLIPILAGCSSKKSNSDMDSFVSSLMSKMTLEEKLGQTNLPAVPSEIVTGNEFCDNVIESIQAGKVGGILNAFGYESMHEYQRIAVEESRLGIPLLVGLDVIHGYKTIFPIPLATACSWDPEMVGEAAKIATIEAGTEGISWVYNPMVDVCRDPRWGRVAEGAGEDAWLNGQFAAAFVKGCQEGGGAASVKHFALYGASEGGRDYRETDMSFSRMYNEYLPPYKAAVDAGTYTVMASFNDINGIPATANKWLLTDVLRDQWGFEGALVSDYNALGELIPHAMGDLKECTRLAIKAGLDIDMVTGGVLQYGEELVKEGAVSEKEIDRACRRILELKYKLGLFDDPYKFLNKEKAEKVILSEENVAAARNAADKSFVLLKNDDKILPLKENATVALVGPLADEGDQYTGCWSCLDPHGHKSLKTAMEEAGVKVIYAKGTNFLEDADLEQQGAFQHPYVRDNRDEAATIREAVSAASRSDVVVAAVGEMAAMSGEGVSRAQIYIPDCQKRLLEALYKTGKPIVLVLFTGRPLVLTEEAEKVSAILNVWFGGSQAGPAIADMLFGKTNPSGKLTMSFPYDVGQIPVYYNMKPVGRPVPRGAGYIRYNSCYFDVPNEPLYPFGYGLSYTTYEYSDVSLSADKMNVSPIKASVTVKNTGDMDGDEIVQLYIRDMVSSESRPMMELKGFKKVHLAAGESANVEFEVTPDMLSWIYCITGSPVKKLEPGEFSIMIGPNSVEYKSASLMVEK